MAEKTETVEIITDTQVVTTTVEETKTTTKQAVDGNLKTLTVEELYDKDKYDLSTMELEEVLQILQYVSYVDPEEWSELICMHDLISLLTPRSLFLLHQYSVPRFIL